MPSVNHGQSKQKKEYPLSSDRHQIDVISEPIDQRQSREKNDEYHAPAEILLVDDMSVREKNDEYHAPAEILLVDDMSVREKNDEYHAPAEIVLADDKSVELETEPIISSEKAMMDYVSIKGIKNRTGAASDELLLYILKELIDNGLDFIDKYAGKVAGSSYLAELSVSVKKESDKLTIRVANSDFGHEGFTPATIESIFTFTGFFSSKRNQYKVSRGALGDALKEVICVPYALAEANDIPSWNEPLIIESGKNIFEVNLDINRANQTISSRVEVKERQRTSADRFTLVEITMPAVRRLDLDIKGFLENYSLLNTHISFNVELSLDGQIVSVKLPACQKPIPTSNLSSIHYYTFAEFKNFVLGLDDHNVPAYEMLQIFREGSNIKKESIPETVGELKNNPERMKELYQELYYLWGPAAPTKVVVPFSTIRKEREIAIIERVQQFGHAVTEIKYASKQCNYNYNSGEIEFPFIVEGAVISLEEVPYNLLYVEGTNCSHRPYRTFLSGRPGTFQWRTKNGKLNNAGTIFDLLEKHGYSFYPEKCKKPGTIIYLNLISPRFDYQNYGKTIIDLKPFAGAIADTMYKVCTAKRDWGSDDNYYTHDTAEGLLTQLLESRLEKIENKPSLINTDRWTQSTVYYRLRPLLIAKGIDVQRKYITSQIRKTCEKVLNRTRAELGIVAADRAQLYFRGRWYDVGLDDLAELMHLGADMLIIEKEGVAEVLSPFADRMGIALLNTRGFLTEYASMLSNLSKENGCNVAILTDFDVSGLLLARKVPGVFRIGIDFATLDYFHLKREDVEEQYKAENNHLKPLYEMGPAEGEDRIIFEKNLEYVTNNRIEIDSVLAKVGNPAFWKYVIHNLTKQFPKRNYNRSIQVPKFVVPDAIIEFLDKIKSKTSSTIKSEYELIKEELQHFEGTIRSVSAQEHKITTRLKTVIANDEEIRSILEQVQKLNHELGTPRKKSDDQQYPQEMR